MYILLLALLLSSCSFNTANVKDTPDYPESWIKSEQIKEFEKNWEIQKKKDGFLHQKWEVFSERAAPKLSACSFNQTPKFDTYELEKTPIGSTENTITTALYCPSEKKYWIEKSGGDIAFEYRYIGPFDLENKRDWGE